MKNKKIEKIKITSDWHGIVFVNTDELLETMIIKINQIIDKLSQLEEKK
jgi:hypothetical protein